jgi:hypothetical protein
MIVNYSRVHRGPSGEGTEVAGTLLDGRTPVTGSPVIISIEGSPPVKAILGGVSLSTRLPEIGLFFLGATPGDLPVGREVAVAPDEEREQSGATRAEERA